MTEAARLGAWPQTAHHVLRPFVCVQSFWQGCTSQQGNGKVLSNCSRTCYALCACSSLQLSLQSSLYLTKCSLSSAASLSLFKRASTFQDQLCI